MRDIGELHVVASLNARPFYESLDYWHAGTKTRTLDGVDIEFIVMGKRPDAERPGR